MTPRQADKIISLAKPVRVRNDRWQEEFTATFVRRDRRNIYSADGGAFDRSELRIVNTEG
jgi:hypothetical protein